MNKPTMLGYSLYPPTTDITCGGFLFNNNQWKKYDEKRYRGRINQCFFTIKRVNLQNGTSSYQINGGTSQKQCKAARFQADFYQIILSDECTTDYA